MKIDWVVGAGGAGLYLDDQRISGNKPWGGGEVKRSWEVDPKELRAVLYREDPYLMVDEVIELLNTYLDFDRRALTYLIRHQVSCNKDMAEHPTIQVRGYDPKTNEPIDTTFVGMLGILNGLFGTRESDGWGHITVILDKAGQIEKFQNTSVTRDAEKT